MNIRYEPGTKKLSRCYRKWTSMRQRCNNPNHIAYSFYGGRGVKVCKRWRSYAAFYADMGDPPKGHWLDRIKNHKGYQPGNCRWVTPTASAANRKARGFVAGSLKDECRKAGVSYAMVYFRMHRGWSKERAMSTPTQWPPKRQRAFRQKSV
jgi:hypothetical protein